ncbi:nitrobenzoate reductase [Duganella sp. Leaf126]|uniref:nitroreductase n=1 Tax=Duganella sp. Leaf126 TaxID=1736266 RepID=UPI0006FEB0A0|nr:nitroreductase [Duganella sp. Leaf126]KQQ33507.1 nitrobenzoate reductase [Duganella sp. Leaf126]
MTSPEQQAVDAAITSRRSIRAYLPQPVAHADIAEILTVAGRAPSGTNTQPWKVYVLQGAAKRALSDAILALHNDPEQARLHTEEYAYYPTEWISPFIERRRKVGWDLYALLGLTRDNKAGMAAQHGKNYDFFGAPVGLIVTVDRVMGQGSWLDCGMFLQNIMVAARGRGLDTCPQAAFTQYHRVIEAHLALPDNEIVVCGMALGYADMSKVENSLVTERMALDEFVKFMS